MILFLVFLPVFSCAEEFRIVPQADPAGSSGKVAAYQGEVGQQGEKFILENLSISQPVEITLLSKDPETDLNLQLCKFDWKKPERSGSTKGTGSQTFKIRTQGDLKIFVASPQGEKPYQLAIWVGEDVKPNMKPVFIPKDQYRKTKGGSGGIGGMFASPVLWIIAALLGAILVVLIMFLKRGKR
ncbi:MAG: hypothetical protein ACYDHW_08520 [Syntrophorhabdaceae bacterium]